MPRPVATCGSGGGAEQHVRGGRDDHAVDLVGRDVGARAPATGLDGHRHSSRSAANRRVAMPERVRIHSSWSRSARRPPRWSRPARDGRRPVRGSWCARRRSAQRCERAWWSPVERRRATPRPAVRSCNLGARRCLCRSRHEDTSYYLRIRWLCYIFPRRVPRYRGAPASWSPPVILTATTSIEVGRETCGTPPHPARGTQAVGNPDIRRPGRSRRFPRCTPPGCRSSPGPLAVAVLGRRAPWVRAHRPIAAAANAGVLPASAPGSAEPAGRRGGPRRRRGRADRHRRTAGGTRPRHRPLPRVSIFLSVLRRACPAGAGPGDGRGRCVHQRGQFHSADLPDGQRVNERNSMVIDTRRQQVVVVQIAGLVARRIVCDASRATRSPRRHLRADPVRLAGRHLLPGRNPTTRPTRPAGRRCRNRARRLHAGPVGAS